MNERELFEKNIHPKLLSWVYFCNDNNVYRLKIVTCATDKFRALSELNFGWSMWQASANREGYKLVPVETLEVALSWADCSLYESWSCEQHAELNKHTDIINKAMIGSVNEH